MKEQMNDMLVQLAFRRWVAYYDYVVFRCGSPDALTWSEWKHAWKQGIIR